MTDEPTPYQEGKRAGVHPAIVVFGVIIGMWLLIALAVPSGKQKQATGPEISQVTTEESDAAPVMFKVHATMPDVNAVSLVVPEGATDSQIVGLLKRLRQARLERSLSTLIPETSPGHKLGGHAVADIYIFSEQRYAQPEAVRTLSRGAHAPGELYPQMIPFEEAMEHVKGHYRIDLNDTGNPDSASLGFADESGIHSRHFRRIF
ncbi:MAG TPA: hypothetical protein VHF07_07735 [Nitrospiraceae bacterium]|nr:hypothetical protein [Nitrospiraceae bacterium]